MMMNVPCRICGESHDLTAIEPSFQKPDAFIGISPVERSVRAIDSKDAVVVRDADATNRRHFLRVLMPFEVRGLQDAYSWGVWVEVAQRDFERVQDLWDSPDQHLEPEFGGTIANVLPGYDVSLSISGRVKLVDRDTIPQFRIERPENHRLKCQQESGVTPEEALEWLLPIYHPDAFAGSDERRWAAVAKELRHEIIAWLKSRSAKPNESVEFSYFSLRVVSELGGDIGIETLDFREMASFTTDLIRVARIHSDQMAQLEKSGVEPCRCTVLHTVVVSEGYRPDHPHVEIIRRHPARNVESGWYVGVQGESKAAFDPSRAQIMSTYELSLYDERFLAFWLLPPGHVVSFSAGQPGSVECREDVIERQTKPWWKVW